MALILLEVSCSMPSRLPIQPTPEACTGCGACERVCPRSCITIKRNIEGFGIAEVNEEDCVACGACRRVCPFTSEGPFLQKPLETFAFRLKDVDKRLRSASGGAFSALAELIMDAGGYVCAAIDDINRGGYFILTDNKNDIRLMQGSKYYYIELDNDVIDKMIEALERGRVLFCGLPCQVHAARLASRDSENFIGIDLLCQGAPSHQVCKAYRDEIEHKSHRGLARHSFRSKADGYKGYTAELEYKDGTIVRQRGDLNLYTCSFQHKLFLREACYNCPFSSPYRPGDITIGDFWGLDSFEGEVPSEVSLLLCNSPIGEELVSDLSSLGSIEPHFLDEAVKGNEPLRGPVKRPAMRSFSFRLMRLFGFSVATVICYPKFLLKKLLLR